MTAVHNTVISVQNSQQLRKIHSIGMYRIIIHHRRVEELHGYQINDLYQVVLLFATPSYEKINVS
jgi:hypothetical protein